MERKPLASNRKIPVAESRTKSVSKRTRSPNVDESVNEGKRVCTDKKAPTGLKRHGSSSCLSTCSVTARTATARQTSAPKLNSVKSSSNLMARKPSSRPTVSHATSTVKSLKPNVRSGAVTAPRPVQGRPPTGASSTLNSTVVSTGAPKTKGRPAWDLKGRLQDMQGELTGCTFRIAHLESLNQKLSGDAEVKHMASQSAVKEIEHLKEKLDQADLEYESHKKKLQRDLEDLEFKKSSIERKKSALEEELADSNNQVTKLQQLSEARNKTIGDLQFAIEQKESEILGLEAKARAHESERQRLNNQIEEWKKMTEAHSKTIEDLKLMIEQKNSEIQVKESRERAHETERRRLHNLVQELKGNIRVFCRVRPLLGEEELCKGGIISHINFPDMDHKILELDKLPDISVNESVLNSTRGGRALSKYEFSFDKVFQPESSQAEVFEEISQLVQSALDGYNVCIFAYGQTGSGKTYTMEGCLEEEDLLGMIPRTVKQIFTAVHDLEGKGWSYKFSASMLEIYNESIYDLLSKGSAREEKLEVKLMAKGEDVHVPKLSIVEVKSEQQVLKLLRNACENRSVAETKCNQRSSRSHSVFQLRLEGTNSTTGESSKGLLNLVDLAGSERVKESGSEGQRLLEAQSINKSLSNLGNVIMALGNKEKHIPYRNSKLTYLLQNSLGGNSKTLMFVNVSPKEECFSETLNSLRFATKVNQCNIGTAQKKS
ncbi:hypothetical protein RRG08_030977 [Elysia crispata]|uniref:Kinesin motor domain-containing protein n=1 Tax=Elysia crispata TaxID=231223 RepID=A0AAE0ZU13_9GAST|nr:hypothetical protein RRG08_030977 [Elysia crispata]